MVRLRALIALSARATAATLTAAAPAHAATARRVLFDNTKAETAGNADWIVSTAQPDPTAQNPNPTGEGSWTGAISAWGVALQRTGQYSLKTLPPGNTITYGGGGSLDLANFDEFVMPEPNSPLSASEKTAILRFVQNGGGFSLVVDHTGSDRNNDGWDSVRVANDLSTAGTTRRVPTRRWRSTRPRGSPEPVPVAADVPPGSCSATPGSRPVRRLRGRRPPAW
jgi:hypothetical protein